MEVERPLKMLSNLGMDANGAEKIFARGLPGYALVAGPLKLNAASLELIES